MYVKVINREITASRWPWQEGYDWKGMTNSTAPLNVGGARFGGGWKFKLGMAVGGSTVLLELGFGMVSITKPSMCTGCGNPILRKHKRGSVFSGGYGYHKECWETA